MLVSKKEERNKRGQGLSTTAIILIVLGVLILVVLIIGFSAGWDRVAPWLGGGNNIDNLKKSCAVACTSDAEYDYCTKKRELKSDEEELKDVTCDFIVQEKAIYGIDACPGTPCGIEFVKLEGVTLASQVTDGSKCPGNEGKTIYSIIDKKLETHLCEITPVVS